MGQWSLVRNGLGVDDLVRNIDSVQGALILLKQYLEDTAKPHPLHMKKRQVRDLMALMGEQGRIMRTDPRYALMNQFYAEFFKQEFPAWVEERVTRRRYE